MLHSVKTNFTAMSGDRVVLPCPIQPGALLEQYSVIWKKGDTRIVDPQDTRTAEPRYNIDRATYSLIIDSVNINDTSSGYQCEVSVTDPLTNAVNVLQLSSEVSLSLTVIGKYKQNICFNYLCVSQELLLWAWFCIAPLPLYELIHQTDNTTELTGSMTFKCLNRYTANKLDISEIHFFLNRSSAADPSLRERGDITVVPVGSTGIKFNLTRRLEGYYTCGKRVDVANVRESVPKPYICKWGFRLGSIWLMILTVTFCSTSDHHPSA